MTEIYINRRKKLIKKIGNGLALIRNAPERIRSRDTQYRYRHDSNFYYLSGFTEPESIIFLVGGNKPKSILFCREKNAELELWDGFRIGPELAKDEFLFDEAYPISQLKKRLPDLINKENMFWELGADAQWDNTLISAIESLKQNSRRSNQLSVGIFDIRNIIHEMRLVKDKSELEVMRRAADVSAKTHKLIMQTIKPGMWEFEVEAKILYEFHKNRSKAAAYTSVVAGGKNACILHYIDNNSELKDGDLLLIDAGCELDGYASDITRTFPISERFTTPQKDIYELVLRAQLAAIDCISAGRHYNEPHDAAIKVLSQGFIDLGLCKGSVDSVIENQEYMKFYMHGTGHWLGMDVHDVGAYKKQNKWIKFIPGMVLTVEPGCYIRPENNIPEHYWNIGIRIEDDVVVKSDGCEIITSKTPKEPEEIEALRKTAHGF